MKYYKVKLACRLENGVYYHDQNKFKYKLEDIKKALDAPRVKELFDNYSMMLYVVDSSNVSYKNILAKDSRVCARVTSVNLDKGYAEVMCNNDTYPMSNIFMDNLDKVAIGLITSGNMGEVDTDGYTIYKPNVFVKFQIVIDDAASSPAEFIGEDFDGTVYGNSSIPVMDEDEKRQMDKIRKED